MDLHQACRIIILVFNVYITFHASKVSAYDYTEQYVPCKPDWYYFGEKCYKIEQNVTKLHSALSWENSVNFCRMEGGQLASIGSKELQEFLASFVALNAKSNAWIGLHDQIKESDFSWVDRSSFNYTNWDDKQPTSRNGHIEEDCVEMLYKGKDGVGKWNDEGCTNLRPPLCQLDANENETSLDPRFCSIEDGGGWKLLNSCYHIVKEEKSWEDAEKYCEEHHKGYLVTILDTTDVFLNQILKLSNMSWIDYWVGIKITNNLTQKWSSGWHVANKYFKQEDLHFADGNCVMKTNWNSWGIVPCTNKHPFICEKMKYNIPVLQKPPSDEWQCPHSGKKWIDLGGDSCYYVAGDASKRWFDALYDCGRLGGTLATFHSENETNLLHPHVLDTQERLFIGLKRNSTNKDVFEWADGGKVDVYTNWHTEEPNNRNEECGELWTDTMKWNDVPCHVSKGYICKALKRFSGSKFHPNKQENLPDKPLPAPCTLALSKDEKIHSSGVSAGAVVGIMFCTLILGLLVGVLVYHYRDNLKRYFTRSENGGYTSTLGPVSDKVFWNQQREDIIEP